MKSKIITLLVLLGLAPMCLIGQTVTVGGAYRSGLGVTPNTVAQQISDSIANMKAGLYETNNTHVYYVSNTGDDANSGLSPYHPIAHHPWMSNYTGSIALQAGDSVCMKRGDVWSISSPTAAFMRIKQSGAEDSLITTTSFGLSGSKPIIKITTDSNFPIVDGRGKSHIRFDNIDFRHHSHIQDESNSLQCAIYGGGGADTISHDWTITNCNFYDVPYTAVMFYPNAYDISIGDTLATATATQKSYSNYFNNIGYAAIGLNGSDSTGISNFKAYYNYINEVNHNDQTGTLGYGIYLSANTLSEQWPNYAYIRFNRVENVDLWEGIDSHGGQNTYIQDNYLYNCKGAIATQSYYDASYPTTVLDSIFIERNTIEYPAVNSTFYAIQLQEGGNTSYGPTNCFVRDNDVFFTTRPVTTAAYYGIYVVSGDYVIVENNRFTNGPQDAGGGAILIGARCDSIFVQDNFIKDWLPGIQIYTPNISGDININHNLIYTSGNGICTDSEGTVTGNINIYNNTVFTTGNYTLYMVNFSLASGKELRIKNNIFGFVNTNADGYYMRLPGITDSSDIIIDHNLLYNSTKVAAFAYKGIIRTFAQWRAIGYDLHGFNNTNPLLKTNHYTKRNDFELQTLSPAIERGVNVGLDYNGFSPDIGAWESGIFNNVVAGTDTTGLRPYRIGMTYIDTDSHKFYISEDTDLGGWLILNLILLISIYRRRK